LIFSKHTIFLVFRFVDCLHKYGLRKIDTIDKIVPFIIRVPIDLIVDHLSIDFHKSREHSRALKHIDVIARAYHAE
jgi:hypothetical protein